MKCLVVGCGSIGSRRAKILAEMGHEVHVMDTDHERMAALRYETDVIMWNDHGGRFACPGFESIKAALDFEPEVVLICTPPEPRLDVVRQVSDCIPVPAIFCEKPLTLDADELIEYAAFGALVPITMGACNLRFDERLDMVSGIPVPEALQLTMGQARHYWSANHRRLPMLLDSIHELDLAAWLMGPIKSIEGQQALDWADVLVGHDSGYSHIHLDRKLNPPFRQAAGFGGHMWAQVDLWPPDPEMYRREMEHFMECVESGKPTCNPLHEAAEVCRWALEVPDG